MNFELARPAFINNKSDANYHKKNMTTNGLFVSITNYQKH